MRALVKKALTLPVMVLAALLVLFEDFVWRHVTVLVAYLARWHLVARLEAWVLTRDRYTTLALFSLPIMALVPIKLTAVWLIVSGHAVLGILVIIAAKVTGTAISARLYMIAQPKLMTFETFVRIRTKVLGFKAWAHQVLFDLRVPETVARIRALIGSRRGGAAGHGWLHHAVIGRLWAARRFLRKPD